MCVGLCVYFGWTKERAGEIGLEKMGLMYVCVCVVYGQWAAEAGLSLFFFFCNNNNNRKKMTN